MAGPLKNPAHERFAQNIVKGMTLAAAYEAAGYKRSEKNAARLRKVEGVATRIAELQTAVAEKTVITVADITQRLLNIAQKGENDGQPAMLSVARASLMDVAKLNGMIVEKTQRELSQDQMNALMDMIRTQPGLAAQLLAQMGIG